MISVNEQFDDIFGKKETIRPFRPRPRRMHLQDIDHEASDWDNDCLFWWGRVLTGADRHWCYDWDELPIDDTCKEYECCTCFK